MPSYVDTAEIKKVGTTLITLNSQVVSHKYNSYTFMQRNPLACQSFQLKLDIRAMRMSHTDLDNM